MLMASASTTQSVVYCPAVIVGAGPAGLAMSAVLLTQYGIPCIVIEKGDCIASLWQHRTYDCLELRLPKQAYQLPLLPFPNSFPTKLNKQQLIDYFETYANTFNIKPLFNECVESAEFDSSKGSWLVKTETMWGGATLTREFHCRWLIVASGEHSEPVIPKFRGIENFGGEMRHTSCYKNGSEFAGDKVLVVGGGDSGKDVYMDLLYHGAVPALLIRNPVHYQEETAKGEFKVFPGIRKLAYKKVKFVDGVTKKFDALIFATGYRNNVTSWLKAQENEMFCRTTGLPDGWKGNHGLYAVGFKNHGIPGIYQDVMQIADDIESVRKAEA